MDACPRHGGCHQRAGGGWPETGGEGEKEDGGEDGHRAEGRMGRGSGFGGLPGRGEGDVRGQVAMGVEGGGVGAVGKKRKGGDRKEEV